MPKSPFKRCTYPEVLSFGKDGVAMQEVCNRPALAAGGLAVVHGMSVAAPGRPWTIVHLRSDRYINHYRTQRAAKTILLKLLPLTDWTLPAGSLNLTELQPVVKRVLTLP